MTQTLAAIGLIAAINPQSLAAIGIYLSPLSKAIGQALGHYIGLELL